MIQDDTDRIYAQHKPDCISQILENARQKSGNELASMEEVFGSVRGNVFPIPRKCHERCDGSLDIDCLQFDVALDTMMLHVF